MDKQCEKLLKALKKRPMTKMQILQLGILNAGGRIYDLRNEHNIETQWVRRGARQHPVALYVYKGRKRKQLKGAA